MGKFKENDSAIFKATISSLNESGDRIVSATLVSGISTGTSKIRASINNEFFDEVEIQFDTAFTQDIVLNPSSFALPVGYDKEITLEGQLKRSSGLPSIGNRVIFEVRDTTNTKNLGLLKNVKNRSDENGLVRTSITLADSTYRGKVIITARAYEGTSETAVESIFVYVTN